MSYLLKPLKAGPLTLANRLVMPPMATMKADVNGKVSQELLEHYDEKSNGGYIGLVIIEHAYIQPEGKAHDRQLSVADDSVVEGLHKLSKVIHCNRSRTVMQISHAGSATTAEIAGTIPVGPSAVMNPLKHTLPHELTSLEIDNVITAFRNAAGRVKKAGFDGVEIHSAHGYLLNQFFSPLTNKRTDEYGGDVYNRIRIHRQVIEAVCEIAGDNFLILLRLGVSDFLEGGTNLEDSIVAAQELKKAGVNILDISGGILGYTVPGLTGQGFFAPFTEAIKKAISIPVILTGGITEAQSAENLLAEDKADLIGVGRTILKDSDWAGRAVESLR